MSDDDENNIIKKHKPAPPPIEMNSSSESHRTEAAANIQEFKIGDADSKIGFDGFSKDGSIGIATPKGTEKAILDNFKDKKKEVPKLPKQQLDKKLQKQQEHRKNLEDREGPKQFRIGDDQDADPTEGFMSVDGNSPSEKAKKKEGHKKMKDAFQSKVHDYKEKKQPYERMESNNTDACRINPKEFVLGDDKSFASSGMILKLAYNNLSDDV